MNPKDNQLQANKYGMAIDLDTCIGCGACMVACMAENNVSFKTDETDKLKSITWLRVYRITNGKPFPGADECYIPRPCQQCGGPHDHGQSPCVSVCPATATDYDHSTGIVSQIYTRCFGCRYCMAACPYHARYFNWWDPVWPEGMETYLSPNVSVRMRGVVEKCTFCFHRHQIAMEKAFSEGRRELDESEYQTACAQACPVGAIVFGDLNNPEHTVYRLKTHPKAFRLLERLDTNPKVYYISNRQWVRRAGDNYLPDEGPGKLSGSRHPGPGTGKKVADSRYRAGLCRHLRQPLGDGAPGHGRAGAAPGALEPVLPELAGGGHHDSSRGLRRHFDHDFLT